jgi:hypothetical protein
MTNKILFCSSYVSFCTFCASLWPKRTVFTRLLKKANNHSSIISNHLTMAPSRPKTSVTSVISVAKNLFNQCNPWLIKELRAYNALYNCRETSTTIESSLQINLFMQNKANFRKVKFDVNRVLTKDYEQMDTWSIRKTKPIQSQLKPIQSQSKPIKANIMPKQTQSCPPSVWRNKPNACPPCRLAGLPAISVAGQRQKKMLLRAKGQSIFYNRPGERL